MKKLFVLVFAIALCLGVLCFGASAEGITASQPTEGDGSAANPFKIGTAGELYWFAQYVNTGSLNKLACAKLTADITINEGVLDAVANSNTDSLNK